MPLVSPLLVQSLMLTPLVDEHRLVSLIQRTSGTPIQTANLPDIISTLNNSLDAISLRLSRRHDPRTGEARYALINTSGDDISQLATTMSPAEAGYVKRLVESIVMGVGFSEPGDHEISSTDALSIAPSCSPPLSKRDAQTLLSKLCAQTWLVERNGTYTLSLRTQMELELYLKENYPDEITECKLCMESTFTDYEECQCGSRLHIYCVNKFKAREERAGQLKCQECHEVWNGTKRSIGKGRTAAQRRTSRNFASQSQRSQRVQRQQEEEEEEDEEVANDPNSDADDVPTPRSSKRTRDAKGKTPLRLAKSRRLQDDDDDEE
ncbi:Nse1 non-SMC component of SMC5-6 complex-domain-containing protein [Gaertneriomyces semiglobifer]|nr:Nse1 non-SMC component of SMC5-6 complex-domain-containing protein [Gaertneriomyces semiglobifer]